MISSEYTHTRTHIKQKPISVIYKAMLTQGIPAYHTGTLSQYGQILQGVGLVYSKKTIHPTWMVKWVPIVPPRSQLLKRDMTSLVFSSAANARSPLTQLDGLD